MSNRRYPRNNPRPRARRCPRCRSLDVGRKDNPPAIVCFECARVIERIEVDA